MQARQRGFSLIELLIVVAIILIIAAIAIPNFLRAKISANESSAVSSVHAIDTAEMSYATMFPTIGYSAALSNLGDGGTMPCPLTKSGYNFIYVQNTASTPSVSFTINANPATQGVTGQRGFYSDESNVIRAESVAPATVTSAPL